LSGATICLALIGTALYFQYVMGLDPCPLCILQRVCVIAVGVVWLGAGLHNPGPVGVRVYGAMTVAIAAIGAGVAGPQGLLQHLPAEQGPACGPGLEYILETFPMHEALGIILRGSGDCAEVNWTFLGLSMAGWMLVVFAIFVVSGALLLYRGGGDRRMFRGLS
jgi:disulfide bond formation protein DsbB